MIDQYQQRAIQTAYVPWNKGKITGQKPPLQSRHVWTIRTQLQLAGRLRDLAMFNLAIDSKLRGCDVVALKVLDVAPHGYCLDRATVRQRKTGQPVKFEMSDHTRSAVDEYIGGRVAESGEYLFKGRHRRDSHLSTRQYARLVSEWIKLAGLDPLQFGTHWSSWMSDTIAELRCENVRSWHSDLARF